MTSILQRARRLVGKGTDVSSRVEGLERAVEAARPYLDHPAVDEAAEVAGRAGARLKLSRDHTVVALAGATGSGKSSTFNALAGLDLAAVGVRRPTTSWTNACVWGAAGAGPLLDWLGIPKRHQVSRDSMLDTGPGEGDSLDGLVLLDLPDHDSTEVAHHVEVNRLVSLTDMLVWVMDPQKYADAAIHDRYLKPLAAHADVMVVVLNHIDEVPEERRQSMVDDLERLLAADGLGDVPVLTTSALDGSGVEALRAEIAGRVAGRSAVSARLLSDVLEAAEQLADATGHSQPAGLSKARRAQLTQALADAAGVPVVVEAVHRSTKVRATRATGWPITSWLGRLRPDPLRRLHLDLGQSGRDLVSSARSSIPEANQVQRAQVDAMVRATAEEESSGLSRPWVEAIRAASVSRLPDINDSLDRAVTSTDLSLAGAPGWTRAVRAAQWLFLLVALGGAGWLGALAVMGYLQFPAPETPRVAGFPLPTLMLLAGVVAGLVLAMLCRVLVSWSAARRAAKVERRLREAVDRVAEDLVIEPMEQTLDAYRRTRSGLTSALR